MDYCLPRGYQARLKPDYFKDNGYEGVWQPDVYPDGATLAGRLEARRIIDVGCGTGQKLASLHPDFEIIGIDYGFNIEACRQLYDFGTWLEIDLDRDESLGISDFTDSVLVCADVIEHLVYPEKLLRLLSDALDRGAGALVLSTPDRDLINTPGNLGPPPNPAHVREWTNGELERFMASSGLLGRFGRTRTNDVLPALRTILAIIPGRSPHQGEIVDTWFEERQQWQRVPEEQDRSFAKYEAWVKGLETYNEWLKKECAAWERRAHAAEARGQLRRLRHLRRLRRALRPMPRRRG
jgi:SAM-dependent methyltransferase